MIEAATPRREELGGRVISGHFASGSMGAGPAARARGPGKSSGAVEPRRSACGTIWAGWFLLPGERRCEATLEGGVMVVTGVAVWCENQDFCSNTHAGPVQATCELPAGWEDAVVDVDGLWMEVNVCGYA